MQIGYTSYSSQAKSIRQQFIIIHYTAGNFQEAICHLTGRKVSAHYLILALNSIDKIYINKKLVVYSLVPEEQISWHAGISFWKNKIHLNDLSIGIEIVNQATNDIFQPYAGSQLEVVITLCKQILGNFSITCGKSY